MKNILIKLSFFSFVILALMLQNARGQQRAVSSVDSTGMMIDRPPAMETIRADEIKTDLFMIASDSMRGRRAGTLSAMKSAAWIAEQARKAGLEPAGDEGTYFQFFSLNRSVLADRSSLSVNGNPVDFWKEAWVPAPADADIDAPIQWLETLPDSSANLSNKVVAMQLKAPEMLPADGMSLWNFRYTLSAVRTQRRALENSGASAIVLVADSTAQESLPYVGLIFRKGIYNLNAREEQPEVPVILVTPDVMADLKTSDARLKAHLRVNNYEFPSANVIAKAPGSDSQLRDEYVLFSSHHDHEGVGLTPVKGDSIWNGADDNASTSVALLAIARAWKKDPPKRSGLFIWHGAEERGLYGSRYFVQHPTVPGSSIKAVLNGDMMGRNAPDSAALLGAIPPHRNSKQLVDVAMESNKAFTDFSIDTSWDAADHPENWYFRSDHLPYARAGIPAIFFTTLLHPDYHTPADNPEKIDITKLTKMARWMYATGWNLAENPQPPKLDENTP